MNGKYGLLGWLSLVGVALILLTSAAVIVQKNSSLAETLALLGVWVIVSFLIMVLTEGVVRGIPRHQITIPLKPTITALAVAALLFVAAGAIGPV